MQASDWTKTEAGHCVCDGWPLARPDQYRCMTIRKLAPRLLRIAKGHFVTEIQWLYGLGLATTLKGEPDVLVALLCIN
jgi:hypothetical protein